MSFFLSTIINKLDKKGRVSTPAHFRTVLKMDGADFLGFVAFRSPSQPCIEGFSMNQMAAFSRTMNSFQLFSEDQNDLTASVFADAEMLLFDKEGRVPLSDGLIRHAGLKDQVCFVGRGPSFQMWAPQTFKNYQTEARARLKVKRPVLNLGPSLPARTNQDNSAAAATHNTFQGAFVNNAAKKNPGPNGNGSESSGGQAL